MNSDKTAKTLVAFQNFGCFSKFCEVCNANVMYIEDDAGCVSDGDSCIFGAADKDQRLMTPMLLL